MTASLSIIRCARSPFSTLADAAFAASLAMSAVMPASAAPATPAPVGETKPSADYTQALGPLMADLTLALSMDGPEKGSIIFSRIPITATFSDAVQFRTIDGRRYADFSSTGAVLRLNSGPGGVRGLSFGPAYTLSAWIRLPEPADMAVIWQFNADCPLIVLKDQFVGWRQGLQPYASFDRRLTGWHHTVVTCDGHRLIFYLDGQRQGTIAYALDADLQCIGNQRNPAEFSHCAGIDDALLFGRDLTKEEIARVMQVRLPFGAPAAAEPASGNLVQNGTLQPAPKTGTKAALESVPTNWRQETYGGEGTCDFAPAGRNGNWCFRITSDTGADVSWTQTIAVEPDSEYLLSCWIKTASIAGATGAMLEINKLNGAQPRSQVLKGTSDWTQVSLKINTKKQTSIDLNLLFGGWGKSTGTAWYEDISCVKVAKALESDTTAYFGTKSPVGTTSADSRSDDSSTGAVVKAALAPATIAPLAKMPTADEVAKTYRDSLVSITGAKGAGAGFVANFAGANCIVTSATAAAAARGVGLQSLGGKPLKAGDAMAAMGSDLFRVAYEPAGRPLELLPSVEKNSAVGDAVVVLSAPSGAAIPGKILSIGTSTIETDAPFTAESNGSPIVHLKTGRVIGVAAYEPPNSYDGKTPAVTHRLGYRLDSVTAWQPVNWVFYFAQATELQNIEKLTADLGALVADLTKNHRVTPGLHNNPAFRSELAAWSSHTGPLAGDQEFIAFMKTLSQEGLASERRRATYEHFQRALAAQQQARDEIGATLEQVIRGAHK